jgi:O-antigen/teichoic acid export membrane protein
MLYEAIKRLTKHSFIYAAGPALHKAVGFLILPWVTLWIGEDVNFGKFVTASMALIVAGQLLGLNLLSGMTRYYFDYEEPRDRRVVVTTTLLLLVVTTGIALLVSILCADQIAAFLFGPEVVPEDSDAVVAVGAILFCQTIGLVGLRYLQVLQQSVSYGLLTTVKLLTEVGFKIYFMGVLGLTYMGMLYSVLVGEALLAIGTIVFLAFKVGLGFSMPVARRLIRFSYPLILSGLCMFGLHQADVFIIGYFKGMGQTGQYGLAYRFGSIANLVLLEAFGLIWFPYVFSLKDTSMLQLICSKVLTYFSLLMCLASLGVAIFRMEIVRLMSAPEFWGIEPAIPIVLLGYVFWAVYQVTSTNFYLRERTVFVSLLMAAAAATNISLNVVLVPAFGYMGAAWATLITFGVLAVACWILAERIFPVGFEIGRVVSPIVLACALYGVSLFAPSGSFAISVAVKCGIWAVFPLALVLGDFLAPEERSRLHGIVVGLRGLGRS